MKPTFYSGISEGVNLLYPKILAAAEKDSSITTLYEGFPFLFNPICERPKIIQEYSILKKIILITISTHPNILSINF